MARKIGDRILVLRFHNTWQFSELNWVGKSVAETLMTEFGQASQFVVDRENRAAGIKRMDLRPEANFTKATLIRLGQSLDADYVVYGGLRRQITVPAVPS